MLKKQISVILSIFVLMSFMIVPITQESFAASKPKAPIALDKISVYDDAIRVRWAFVSGAKGYQLYRNGKKIASFNSKEDEYFDTSLKSNKTYKYKVRAYKKSNGKTLYGPFTKTLTVTTEGPYRTDIDNIRNEVNKAIKKNIKNRKISCQMDDAETFDGYELNEELNDLAQTWAVRRYKKGTRVGFSKSIYKDVVAAYGEAGYEVVKPWIPSIRSFKESNLIKKIEKHGTYEATTYEMIHNKDLKYIGIGYYKGNLIIIIIPDPNAY